jgi:sugar-specific transcriptional regulator TrmB
MDISEKLTSFGLTRQEALIYLTLLTVGDLNGYEVAKKTGISRSNAYTSLASLVEKGGAFIIEEATIRYSPVSVKEFCENKIRKLIETKTELLGMIPQKRDTVEGYITIRGEENILNKLTNMIGAAQERIYLSVPTAILDLLRGTIKESIARGIKTVIITNSSDYPEGAIIYSTAQPLTQIRLIVDSTTVLTGDLNSGDYSTCLYSRKQNLVDLIKDAMKNEIKLIEIMKGNQVL